ncbi:hypothetical protein HYS48_01025 [Candidatus Woesearchaeota archaeon]|nr:hypothetical protein [Candidatus Woesearchaeota archaeon]
MIAMIPHAAKAAVYKKFVSAHQAGQGHNVRPSEHHLAQANNFQYGKEYYVVSLK